MVDSRCIKYIIIYFGLSHIEVNSGPTNFFFFSNQFLGKLNMIDSRPYKAKSGDDPNNAPQTLILVLISDKPN